MLLSTLKRNKDISKEWDVSKFMILQVNIVPLIFVGVYVHVGFFCVYAATRVLLLLLLFLFFFGYLYVCVCMCVFN